MIKGTVAMRKLKALEEGSLTDTIFLVGENDETAQEIRAFRVDLIVSSEFFEKLLDSPLTQTSDRKIRLKNIEPEIFKIVIEFIHMCGHLIVSKVDNLETCLKVASAAEEYMIEDLAELCSKLLEDKFLKVDNVWAMLHKYHLVNAIASPCLKLLSLKTEDCLRHKSFLQISDDGLKLFLSLDEMAISSESELLRACVKYSGNFADQRSAFREICLPDLRLFADDIKMDLVQEIMHLLTNDELTCLAAFKHPLRRNWCPKIVPTLSALTKSRARVTLEDYDSYCASYYPTPYY
ncbi:uncharacterized protein LOC135936977 [Cloeon dipterum]|uniref:uncharacterized protein LOC135936977 n=1 Tax=Cloeon dipterum TaxID=197152 RepID=UPI0032205C37